MTSLTQEMIQSAWRRKNAFFYLVLIPLSWLFSIVTALRRWAYRVGILKSYSLPVSVIVVGNINVGGSGKTPVVMWLVDQLKQNGYQPAVVSRGYGGSARLPTSVNANTEATVAGDEPVLVANRCGCPVWVGADRVHVATALLNAHPECNVIISDDALQHYALRRHIEIAVVDERIERNARLLPAGHLREPLARLSTVDAIIFNGEKTINIAYQMQLAGDEFYNLADSSIKATALDFKRKTVMAMAGIGNPERFFAHLRDLGLTFASIQFIDHYAYTAKDLANIDCDVIIMTEKDAVKCKAFARPNCWVLPVEASIDKALMPVILSKLANNQKLN